MVHDPSAEIADPPFPFFVARIWSFESAQDRQSVEWCSVKPASPAMRASAGRNEGVPRLYLRDTLHEERASGRFRP